MSGGTPAADSNEYVLFDSTIALGAGLMQVKGIDRGQFMVDNPAAGTLKSYWSPDKGTTWNLNSTTSVAARGGGATSGILASPFDYSLSGFADWKLAWLNSGTAQTGWQPTLTLSRGQKALSF
ncbi:MAG TPA: hypothetical protein VN697_03400 [Tepidiformaceae bacterium]|nr:hypothetical protein [Tepidiformaceae bacterium]